MRDMEESASHGTTPLLGPSSRDTLQKGVGVHRLLEVPHKALAGSNH